MKEEQGAGKVGRGRPDYWRWAAIIGLVVSTLALMLAFKLPSRLWQSLDALLRLDFDLDNMEARLAPATNPFANVASPFPTFPLLMLILWLFCAWFLSMRGRIQEEFSTQRREDAKGRKGFLAGFIHPSRPLLVFILHPLILVLAFAVRASQLLPNSAGRLPAPNYDEMVYFEAATLTAGGEWPYRDYFLAHPPAAIGLFGAIFKLAGKAAGGYDAFLLGRWLTVGLGVATCAGIMWAAGRMCGSFGKSLFTTYPALLAGLIYALDVRASQVAVLETVSNFFAVLSFGAFLEAEQNGKRRKIWLIVAGGLAMTATLSKLPGLALLVGLVLYLVVNWRWRDLGWLAVGGGAVGLIIGGFFGLVGGPGSVVRQVVFFQLLRPQEVRAGKDQIGTIADYPEAALTILLAAVVFGLLAWQLVRGRMRAGVWLIPVIWSIPLVAVLVVGKSFHPWYYVQLALPLALLIGGLAAPHLWWFGRRWVGLALAGCLIIIAGPQLVRQWQEGQRPVYDRAYLPVAQYLQNQPGNDALLTFDPGYALMSGRTPARLPDGKRLVDSAGYMVYLNQDIDRRGWLDLVGAGLALSRERDQVQTIFQRDRAQAIVAQGVRPGNWVALDGIIALQGQLTPRTVEYYATAADKLKTIEYVDLYRAHSQQDSLRQWQFDNGLQLTPLGLSTSLNGQANADPIQPDGTLALTKTEGRTLDIRLGWQVKNSPGQSLKVFVHVTDEKSGQTVAQRDVLPLDDKGDTKTWRTGDAYQDVHSLPLPSLPPGRYRVEVGLYEPTSQQRVGVESQGAVVIGVIEVKS